MADVKIIEKETELGIAITEKEIISSEVLIVKKGLHTSAEVFKLKAIELIAKLEARGVSREQIINVLLDDFENNGVLFGSLKRQFSNAGVGFVTNVDNRVKNVYFAEEYPKDKLMWVCVLVNTCYDCLQRHGLLKSYEEWESLGLPASGWSVCGSNCMCDIIPESIAESKKDLQAPIKRVKGKIREIAKSKKVKNINRYVNSKLGSIANTKDPIRKQYRKLLK